MAVNTPNGQYIGARYVPKVFKNPDDGSAYWKANTEYEALTIVVVNSGDSYTSRQAVPRNIGSPEDNPNYWAKTGDFNASLLALQNRVNNIGTKIGNETLETDAQTLSGSINELNDKNGTLEKHKSASFNVVELGADNTGTNDNSTIFNELFNSSDYIKAVFYFPDGVYNIDNMVTINNGASMLLAPNAVIKATTSMDAMFAFNTEAISVSHVATPYYINAHRYIRGGIFDAQHLASRCINLRQYFDTKVDTVTFYNVEIAIDTTSNLGTENAGEGAELLIENCRVQNAIDYTLPSIGFKVANDNVIDNCFFVNVSEAIILTAGGNALSNIHGWVFNNPLALISKFIQTRGIVNYASNVYCDNIPCCVYWNDNGYFMLSNCRILLGATTNGYTGALFDGSTSGTLNVSNIQISSDYDFPFCDATHDRYGSIEGLQSQNNNCLPIQPVYTNADWNKYTNDKPISTLENIKSGTYAGTALGRPSGVNWCYYEIKKFSGGNYLMVAYATAGKMFFRFGKWNDSWYNADGSGSVPAVTS